VNGILIRSRVVVLFHLSECFVWVHLVQTYLNGVLLFLELYLFSLWRRGDRVGYFITIDKAKCRLYVNLT